MDRFVIHSSLPILNRPPPVSITSHTLPLLAFAQGEDITYCHSEDSEYIMPPDIDYMPWVKPASSSFSLSLPFPIPRCCYIMLCSHRRAFCMFAGWMEAFPGLVRHQRNAGKMTHLGAVKWCSRGQLVFEIQLSFFTELNL